MILANKIKAGKAENKESFCKGSILGCHKSLQSWRSIISIETWNAMKLEQIISVPSWPEELCQGH